MRLVADTHVHVYDCYNLQKAFSAAVSNLKRIAGEGASDTAVHALCLTERHDCRFFRNAGEMKVPDWSVDAVQSESVAIRHADGAGLVILAGRQIVTRERLEILALTVDAGVEDGAGIMETISRVNEAGGVAVLPWSPGKWWGGRGAIVSRVLNETDPRKLLVGDSLARPAGWGEPGLMRAAREKGFKIVAGSDPLPFAGEEGLIGRYAITCEAEFDIKSPARELRRILRDPAVKIKRAGDRNNLLSFLLRALKLHYHG